MDARLSPLSRRGFVAGGTLTLAGLATGCSLNNPLSDEKTPATEAVRDLSPDVALAVTAAAAVRTQQELLRATAAVHPALTATTARFAAMHEAHLAALADAVPDRVDLSPTGAPFVPDRDRARARAAALAGERGLRGTLVGLALRAESGPFARLLGSMAASVSQHLVANGVAR